MREDYAGMDFEAAVRRFSDHITRLCVVLTHDPEAAKDCFQNTFLKLYQTTTEFHDAEHLKAWLLRVARNECRDFQRTFWNRRVDLGFLPQEEEQAGEDCDEETERLLAALHSLPEKYREVLFLYYYEEYDTNEISELLHASVNTVKSRLRRGREKLAGIMQDQEKITWR